PVEVVRASNPRMIPGVEELDDAARILNDAKRVTILTGAGVPVAHTELLEIAAHLQAPVVNALGRKEHAEYHNPYDIGLTVLPRCASGHRVMYDADAWLMIGTDLPYRQFYPDVPVIQIDRRGEQIGKRVPVDVPLVGTAKDTIRELLPRLAPT